MKRVQIIGIAIAAVAGIAAFVMMRGLVNRPPETKTERVEINTTEVLVASRDIGLGEIVASHDFTWQKWPKDGVRNGLITSQNKDAKRKIAGSIVRGAIVAGEPASLQKLVKPGQGGVLAAILPQGMRAVATRIEQKTAVGGLILPNDHVDVILIRRNRGGSRGDNFVADTLFRNVRVLAIGQQLQTAKGKKAAESGSSTTTATLELTPRQAETLALANSMGEITLSLRSVSDLDATGQGLTKNDLSNERGNSIGVTRYGVKSRAYGVN